MPTVHTIQYLRGLAALCVLFQHATGMSTGNMVTVPAAAVDVFFTISGFVMVWGMLHRPVPAGEFLWHRMARVLPIYWLVTLAVVALALLGLMPRMEITAEAVVKSLLFIPYDVVPPQPMPLVAPGWTLNYEAYFYLLCTLALLLPGRLAIAGLLGTLGALGTIGLLLRPDIAWLRVWTDPLLFEIAAGGAIALLHARGFTPGRAAGVLLIAAALGILVAQEVLGLPGWPLSRFLLWGVPAAMIVFGALALEPAREPFYLKPFGVLGDASYSLYLTHILVIATVIRLVGTQSLALVLLLSFLLAVAVGVACFHLVERPAMRWLRRRPPRWARPAPRRVAQPAE
jgi:exopolysaccharide production protein ExoZ